MQYQRLDVVEMWDGAQFAITEIKPTRPVNPYLGFNMRGRTGKLYKFGDRDIRRKSGTIPENHPFLQPREKPKLYQGP